MAQVLFVSLISRDDKPLYIQSFDNGDDTNTQSANDFLKYNFLSHMALDVFASPVSLSLREHQQTDGVLLLFIQDAVSVYGLETNNGLKIVVGMGGADAPMADIKTLFSTIHKCYLRTICNPFSEVAGGGNADGILQNSRFDSGIVRIVGDWARTPQLA